MMPDLGKYAFAVLSSYGVAIGLLLGLVAVSVWRGRRVKAALQAAEARAKSAAQNAGQSMGQSNG
ncbi:MAG: heme exporter protein CcmD [Rhodobacteraceae bacterium GWE1_64_9]|nr:heme exporter protein CcmD [Gemmobacter sp.]OHC44731.1 MAG: heme exporter protein CcmD [Rhodobacteraceae bacterium GWE1_64_9]OHC48211.1 MAG: heme exporter protein CcmD [Rhodobacteraceae bacterium GWF1_65_7]HBD89187.1 heme exporter protein CcmD [Gemmobacter sp.]HBU14871.1 heme exporter protein CcmD [Gemmobacter sp.]